MAIHKGLAVHSVWRGQGGLLCPEEARVPGLGWGRPGGGIWNDGPCVRPKTATEIRPQEVPGPALGPSEPGQSLQ